MALATLLFLREYIDELSSTFECKLVMPSYCICLSAWGDMTLHLESVLHNSGTDYIPLPESMGLNMAFLYAYGHYGYAHRVDGTLDDQKHMRTVQQNPYICPSLCGDFGARSGKSDMCPVLLQCGSAEMLMSDSIAVYLSSIQPSVADSVDSEKQF